MTVEGRYWRMWAVLALLPALSVAAYLTGVRGLAIGASILVVLSSTYLATTRFMHIDAEPRFVPYLCVAAFLFSLMFMVLVAPDVMRHQGQNWTREAGAEPSHGGEH